MIPLSQVMTGNPAAVHSDEPIRKALDFMTEGRFCRLAVMEGTK
jgi:CBS domain-containing protein